MVEIDTNMLRFDEHFKITHTVLDDYFVVFVPRPSDFHFVLFVCLALFLFVDNLAPMGSLSLFLYVQEDLANFI